MPEQQLHLFEPPKPLLERFGAAFFKAVPRKPGVYIMSGEGERVLYIGQSGNLRQRLGSYKNARPDRAPRKIIRLVHLVRSLVWEECETVAAARLKEAQLLRVHRPKFNVQSTYPRAYRYISVKGEGPRLELSIGTEPKREGRSYGAFKTGSVWAFGALLRLLWAARHRTTSPHDFPASLVQGRPPGEFKLEFPEAEGPLALPSLQPALERYFAGEAEELSALLAGALPGEAETSAFQRNLFANDLESVIHFFAHGCQRNRNLRLAYGVEEPILAQETLDDLLALDLKPRASGARDESRIDVK